jgi:hypothetical protein
MDRDTGSGRVALPVALVCARLAVVLAAPLSLLAPAPGRGDTADASSTTMAIVRDRWNSGTSETIAPLYELLSVSARDVRNPVAENLQLVVSGWGGLSLGSNLVWYDTTAPKYRAFGDLDLAYLQGEVLSRSLQVRLGRQLVGAGVTGALQLDGGNVIVRLPYGLGISGYVGSPVQQRFNGRGTDETFNPHQGNFAAGGRAYWTVPRWGEVGASVVQVSDHGDPSRQQVGGDVRVVPIAPLTVLASAG